MWIPLPRELNDWWRNRNEMRLVKEGSTWQIQGPEKRRARIAYASLDGDRVSYSFDFVPDSSGRPMIADAQPSPSETQIAGGRG
jgi:hypothetical protein